MTVTTTTQSMPLMDDETTAGGPDPEQIREWLEEFQMLTRTGRFDQYTHCPPHEAFARLGLGAEFTLDDWAALDWYGPIERWREPAAEVSDIFHNGPPDSPFFIIQRGAIMNTQLQIHPQWLTWTQRQLLLRSGKIVRDEQGRALWPRPAIQGVADGLRYAVTTRPITMHPSLSIRLLPPTWRTLQDLVLEHTLPQDAADLLMTAVQRGSTLLVCGPTGSGKTTLAAAIIGEISASSRVVFIEDGTELPRQANSVHNDIGEGGPGAFSNAIRFALRQKPDYIVVGEVRGSEAMAMLQAASTGHPGVCTIHATNVQAALRNLERMAMIGLATESGGGGQAAAQIVRGLITSDTVNLMVVHIGFDPWRRRRVLAIEEVSRMNAQSSGGETFGTIRVFAYDTTLQALLRQDWASFETTG